MPGPDNRRWLLARRPVGSIRDGDLAWDVTGVTEPRDGEILARCDYVACDPAQLTWMSSDNYFPAIAVGDVVRAFGAGRVVASRSPDYREGELVQGLFGWQDYAVVGARTLFPTLRVPPSVSPETALGVLGVSGLAAYFGIVEVGRVREGETVVVSAAAGATGSAAGQIAKRLGARVVGIAGGPEKCAHVVDVLGFDAAIDHRHENLVSRLRECCPDGVNVFFDNVGGRVLDAVLLFLALHGRVVICGGISSYADTSPASGPRNYLRLLRQRGRMEGFNVIDFEDRLGEAVASLAAWVGEGALTSHVDVVDGLENAPRAFARLFEGANLGKQLVRVSATAGPR